MSATEPDPYRLLLDEVGAFVYTTDLQGRYTFANRMVLQLLGHPLDYVVGKDISHFFGDKGNEALRETDRRVLQLAYWDDLAPIEIGDVLGVDLVDVFRRLTRATERLGARLEKHGVMEEQLVDVLREAKPGTHRR